MDRLHDSDVGLGERAQERLGLRLVGLGNGARLRERLLFQHVKVFLAGGDKRLVLGLRLLQVAEFRFKAGDFLQRLFQFHVNLLRRWTLGAIIEDDRAACDSGFRYVSRGSAAGQNLGIELTRVRHKAPLNRLVSLQVADSFLTEGLKLRLVTQVKEQAVRAEIVEGAGRGRA